MENLNLIELRNWLIFFGAVIGSIITIRTFISNSRQRKLENTFKTLDYMRTHIKSEQIDTFKSLFYANNELAGYKYDEFNFGDGRIDHIENMFSEGGCGNGDIQNIIEVINLISGFMLKNELVDILIWYEYGQIMSVCFKWTDYLEKNVEFPIAKIDKKTDYKKTLFFYQFNLYMRKNSNKISTKPMKYYVYAE